MSATTFCRASRVFTSSMRQHVGYVHLYYCRSDLRENWHGNEKKSAIFEGVYMYLVVIIITVDKILQNDLLRALTLLYQTSVYSEYKNNNYY